MTACKVLLKSPFSTYSGYGRDGFGLLRALDAFGLDVYPQPTWLDVPIPPDLLHLFGKTLLGPFDLTINHWDPSDLGIRKEARQMTRVAVAWTMWEFAPAPAPVEMDVLVPGKRGPDGGKVYERKLVQPRSGLVPHCQKRGSLTERLKWFDLLLGYDPVSVASLSPYTPKHTAVGVLQGGYDSALWKPVERDWFSDRFGFFMHGALNSRKCPYTAIQAFLELKDERPEFAPATLSLHTNLPGNVFPEMNDIFKDKKIRVWVDSWPKETVDEFYAANHVFVCPSRGEGKNLPALEFLTTGGTAIVTNFGGHTMWLRDDIAYPLDYILMPTFPHRPDAAHDARVSVQAMKDGMWHAFTHREECKRKGELAQRLIPQMCDWSVVVESLLRRVRDLVPGPGPQVYDLAMRAHAEQESRRGDLEGLRMELFP